MGGNQTPGSVTGTGDAHHRGWSETDELVGVIVGAVADATGVDPLDLDPLYEVIDPEALESIFRNGAHTGGDITVSFEYAGCTVFVSNGIVTVREARSNDPDPTPSTSGSASDPAPVDE